MKEKKEKWVCYYRVSTDRQGQSGLGLEAQKNSVAGFLNGRNGEIVKEFTEVESGKKKDRPRLNEALELCKKEKATLVIAKLDRLARNVHFISGLIESNVDFVAVDMPSRAPFMLHLMAAFAEEEARRISERTKAALKAAKARGVIIGATGREKAEIYRKEAEQKAQEYRCVVEELKDEGVDTVRGLRDALNQRGIESPGGARWHLPNTHRLLCRLQMTLK